MRIMIRQLMLDIKYSLTTISTLIAVVLSFISFMMTALAEEGGGDLLSLYKISITFGIFSAAAPFIAVVPCIKDIAMHRGEIMKYHLCRTSIRHYISEKAVVFSITGGIALMSGPAIGLLVLGVKYPIAGESYLNLYSLSFEPEYNVSFSYLLVNNKFIAFLTAKLFMVFLFGFNSCMIAFTAGTCTKEPLAITFSPFIVMEMIKVFFVNDTYLLNPYAYLNGDISHLPFDNTYGFMGFIIAIHMAITLICLIISNIVTSWRLRNV